MGVPELLSADMRVKPGDLEASVSYDDVIEMCHRLPGFEDEPQHIQEYMIEATWAAISSVSNPMRRSGVELAVNQAGLNAAVDARTEEIDDKLVDLNRSYKRLVVVAIFFGFTLRGGFDLLFNWLTK